MNPCRPRILTAVPQTLAVRLEIMKAIRSLALDDSVEKFDPDQPRVSAGNRDGGQWASDSSADDVDPAEILARAKQLAASRASMSRCVDLCYPLLERFQPAGSDRNEFDFRKCLNECLGLNR